MPTPFVLRVLVQGYNIILGNLDLDPEEIDTYEVSLGAEFTPSLSGRVTLYYRETKDLILWDVITCIGKRR